MNFVPNTQNLILQALHQTSMEFRRIKIALYKYISPEIYLRLQLHGTYIDFFWSTVFFFSKEFLSLSNTYQIRNICLLFIFLIISNYLISSDTRQIVKPDNGFWSRFPFFSFLKLFFLSKLLASYYQIKFSITKLRTEIHFFI